MTYPATPGAALHVTLRMCTSGQGPSDAIKESIFAFQGILLDPALEGVTCHN